MSLRPVVARGYPVFVRKRVLRCCAMALLLLSRLVVGEFAHAVPSPHAPLEPKAVAASTQSTDCPEHQAADSGTDSQSSEIASSSDPHHSCCKSGTCQCPCMHVPAAVLASFLATSVHVD